MIGNTVCFSEQLQFSEVLVKWRRFFNFLAAQQGKSEMMVLEQKLELEQLKVCLIHDQACCHWTGVLKLFKAVFPLIVFQFDDFSCLSLKTISVFLITEIFVW